MRCWRHMQTRSADRGFTLLEVILAMSIISVLSGIMYWFFWNSATLTRRETDEARDLQLVRAVLDRIANELRQSSGFVSGFGPGLIGRDDDQKGSMISINTVVIPDKELMYPQLLKHSKQKVGQFDLREVSYYIAWDEENVDDDGEPRPLGLVRKESKTLLRTMVIEGDETADTGDDETTIAIKEELYAPEIKFIDFRYFDGAQWWCDWEITQGNSLPQLVEVTLGFNPVLPSDREEYRDEQLEAESRLKRLAPDRFTTTVRLTQADTFFGSRITREASSLMSLDGGEEAEE